MFAPSHIGRKRVAESKYDCSSTVGLGREQTPVVSVNPEPQGCHLLTTSSTAASPGRGHDVQKADTFPQLTCGATRNVF